MTFQLTTTVKVGNIDAGYVTSKAGEIAAYFRARLSGDDRRVTSKMLPTAKIIEVWEASEGKEDMTLELLERRLTEMAAGVERINPDKQEDKGNVSINKLSASSAFVIAKKLNTAHFRETMQTIYAADKVAADAPLTVLGVVREAIPDDELLALPVYGTYSFEANEAARTKAPSDLVLRRGSNRQAHYYRSSKIVKGVAKPYTANFYNVTIDETDLGREQAILVRDYNTVETSKGKDGPANLVQLFSKRKDFNTSKKMEEKKQTRLRSLFLKAVRIVQMQNEFDTKLKDKVWYEFSEVGGPNPVALGNILKGKDGKTYRDAATAAYSVGQFISFRVDAAIASDGGTVTSLLATMGRDDSDDEQEDTGITTVDQWLTGVVHLANYLDKVDIVTLRQQLAASTGKGADINILMAISRVKTQLDHIYPNIKVRVAREDERLRAKEEQDAADQDAENAA